MATLNKGDNDDDHDDDDDDDNVGVTTFPPTFIHFVLVHRLIAT